jgi:flavin-dependent dehydrogenase
VPTRLGSVGEVYLGRRGYCILNPQGDATANVAVVVDHRDLPLHRPWRETFRKLLESYPAIREKLDKAVPHTRLRILGPLACRARQVAGDGFLLVGDAAGYYDPMTGEGIFQALKGAESAAETVGGALGQGEATALALEPYTVAYHREFDPKERVCRLLQQIVRNPRLCDFVVRRLRDRGDQIQELMGVVGDLLPPQRLLRPAFWASLLIGRSLS